MRWIFTIALMLFLVGCSTAPSNVMEQGSMTNEPSVVDEPAVVDEPPDSGFTGFKEMIGLTPTYMVSYTYTAAGESSTMTQYFKGGKMRVDSTAEGVSSRVYIIDGTATTCTNQDGWMCLEMPEAEGTEDNGLANIRTDVDSYEDSVTFKGTRNLLGETTNCYGVTMPGTAYTYCFTAEGIPLLMEGSSQGVEWSWVATSFSRDVDDSAFDLPAQPQSLESMLPPGVEMPQI